MTFDVRTINEELEQCDLSFREQCEIIYAGMQRGVKHDGCTGVPDFNFTICCAEHDTHYQTGDISRWAADRKLAKCILKKGVPSKIGPIPYNSNWLLAGSYYVGVTFLGWLFYNRRRKDEKTRIAIADVDRDIAGP